ncbi:MAG: hypothetical protein KDE20_17510 [Caldilineaceae bacterium]|nr:hypothetical protein [Caldilineaceae bacterium]
MNIQTNTQIPDSTYFTMSDVAPVITDNGDIEITNGEGSRRSWGRPQVTSTVVLDECDIVAIHVGFSHKHRGGQGWHYFTTDGLETTKVTWAQLPDELRRRILDASNKAPSWAKAPGKLRSQHAKPSTRTQTAYKLVRMDGDRMVSIYDGRTEYVIGKRLGEAVNAKIDVWDGMAVTHDGGYYSHPSVEQALDLYNSGNLVPTSRLDMGDKLALIECEISGKIARYPNGKLASTYLKPVAVLRTIVYGEAVPV